MKFCHYMTTPDETMVAIPRKIARCVLSFMESKSVVSYDHGKEISGYTAGERNSPVSIFVIPL